MCCDLRLLIWAIVVIFSAFSLTMTWALYNIHTETRGQQEEIECVPICFRENQHPRSIIGTTSGDAFIYGQIESHFTGEKLVAFNYGGSQTCYFSSLSHVTSRECVSGQSAIYSNQYTVVMSQAAIESMRSHTEDLSILVIGHGVGRITLFQHTAFPTADIDSIDIDGAVLTASEEWFCFNQQYADSERVHIYQYDAFEYVRDLVGDDMISYEIIHFDGYKGCKLESSSQNEQFFERVRTLWKQWNLKDCRPRVLVANAYLEGYEIDERPIFQAAADVFGRENMFIHSDEIFAVSSPGCKASSI